MTHWIIAPIVIPAVLAAIMVLAMRGNLFLQRVFSGAAAVGMLVLALGLLVQAAGGTITVYELGNWPAPFGIVLVLDRLSALMVLLSAVLALVVLAYAAGSGWDGRGRHFHALFQFQLMGINGAFLTGDAFNLFVFFEILLIASYGLMIHGGGAMRFRAGVQYVAYNLLASALFLFALGTIYAVTGTLNMADIAVRVAALGPEHTALMRVGAILLLLVFAAKAALLPLHFWLPETYANAPAPVAALFAIMTKVGAYGILRMFTLAFGPGVAATEGIAGPWLMAAALITLAIGMIGMLGAERLGRLAAFGAIASMGTVLVALTQFTPQSTAAGLYYIIHSTLAVAALFFVVDLVRARRSEALRPAPAIAQHGLIAALFFATAIAMAGLPPLSGFAGKLLILDAVRGGDHVVLIWAVILATSLVAIAALARAGSLVFWGGSGGGVKAAAVPATLRPVPLIATVALVAAIGALAVFSGPVTAYLDATAAQLHAPQGYIAAVLGPVSLEGGLQ
ncbi:MAG: monovalent cation/H+ antiporter subunit D [Paracoccaceae bacterium]